MLNVAIKIPGSGHIADSGKVRTGGGCRIIRTPSAAIADAGKVRTGGGCRIIRR